VTGSFHDVAGFGRLVFSSALPLTREAPAAEAATLSVRLRIDWRALGLDPPRAKLTAPPIAFFQTPARFAPDQPIPVEAGKGWLLVLEG
jgi:hypothetical protein